MRPEGERPVDPHLAILDRLDAAPRRRTVPQRTTGRAGAPGLGRRMRARLELIRRLSGSAAMAPARAAGAVIDVCRRVVLITGAFVGRVVRDGAAAARAGWGSIVGMAVTGLWRAFRRPASRGAASARNARTSTADAADAASPAVTRRVGRVAIGVAATRRAAAGVARAALRDGRTAFTGAARAAAHARSATSAAGSRVLTATRAAGARVLAPSSYAAGAAVLVVVVLVATLARRAHLSVPPTVIDAVRDLATDGPAPLLGGLAALRDPSLPDDAKLAIIEDVARDASNDATEVLLSAVRNVSLVVSMAGIRALRGRPCEQIGAALARRLSHRDWQRRAWAAKVLGENGCTAAAPALRNRLMRERDARVRGQLAAALATLIAHAG